VSKHWYEHWLNKAAEQERTGALVQAISSLGRAEKNTYDSEELRYLNIWRNRLKKEAAAKAGGKP
jgi:hypothetical protein